MQLIDIAILDNLLVEGSVEIENISVPTIDKYMLLASIERLKSYGFVGVNDLSFIGSKGEFKKVAYVSSLGKIIYNAINV
ncbi:hypothetical protein [Paenibacillus taichungensis]